LGGCATTTDINEENPTPIQQNISETTDATKYILLMPPFGDDYDYEEVFILIWKETLQERQLRIL
jgi:hypothetical protein